MRLRGQALHGALCALALALVLGVAPVASASQAIALLVEGGAPGVDPEPDQETLRRVRRSLRHIGLAVDRDNPDRNAVWILSTNPKLATPVPDIGLDGRPTRANLRLALEELAAKRVGEYNRPFYLVLTGPALPERFLLHGDGAEGLSASEIGELLGRFEQAAGGGSMARILVLGCSAAGSLTPEAFVKSSAGAWWGVIGACRGVGPAFRGPTHPEFEPIGEGDLFTAEFFRYLARTDQRAIDRGSNIIKAFEGARSVAWHYSRGTSKTSNRTFPGQLPFLVAGSEAAKPGNRDQPHGLFAVPNLTYDPELTPLYAELEPLSQFVDSSVTGRNPVLGVRLAIDQGSPPSWAQTMRSVALVRDRKARRLAFPDTVGNVVAALRLAVESSDKPQPETIPGGDGEFWLRFRLDQYRRLDGVLDRFDQDGWWEGLVRAYVPNQPGDPDFGDDSRKPPDFHVASTSHPLAIPVSGAGEDDKLADFLLQHPYVTDPDPAKNTGYYDASLPLRFAWDGHQSLVGVLHPEVAYVLEIYADDSGSPPQLTRIVDRQVPWTVLDRSELLTLVEADSDDILYWTVRAVAPDGAWGYSREGLRRLAVRDLGGAGFNGQGHNEGDHRLVEGG